MLKLDFKVNGRSVPIDRMADELKKQATQEIEKELVTKVRRAAAGKGKLEIKVERDARGQFKSIVLTGDEAAVEAAQKAMK